MANTEHDEIGEFTRVMEGHGSLAAQHVPPFVPLLSTFHFTLMADLEEVFENP